MCFSSTALRASWDSSHMFCFSWSFSFIFYGSRTEAVCNRRLLLLPATSLQISQDNHQNQRLYFCWKYVCIILHYNHRVIGFKGALGGPLVWLLAQSRINTESRPDLKNLQGWKRHNLFGVLVLLPNYPHSDFSAPCHKSFPLIWSCNLCFLLHVHCVSSSSSVQRGPFQRARAWLSRPLLNLTQLFNICFVPRVQNWTQYSKYCLTSTD